MQTEQEHLEYIPSSLPPLVYDGFVPADAHTASLPPASDSARNWNPGGWNKGLRMPHVPPSDEFNDLYAAALAAFVESGEGSHDRALQLVNQAIAVNPEVYAAHALLSEIFLANNEDGRAIAAL